MLCFESNQSSLVMSLKRERQLDDSSITKSVEEYFGMKVESVELIQPLWKGFGSVHRVVVASGSFVVKQVSVPEEVELTEDTLRKKKSYNIE